MIALLVAATISVLNVVSHPAVDTAVVYATIHNGAATSDVLDRVETTLGSASLHRSEESTHNGMSMSSMAAVSSIAVPAHGDVRLAPGGYHVMIENLQAPLQPGQHIALRLHFRNGGWVSVSGLVTPY